MGRKQIIKNIITKGFKQSEQIKDISILDYQKPLLRYAFFNKNQLKEELITKHKINPTVIKELFKQKPQQLTESLLNVIDGKIIKTIITEKFFKCSIEDIEKRAKKIVFVKYNWNPKNVLFDTKNDVVQITSIDDLKPELQNESNDDLIFNFLEILSKKYIKDLNSEFVGFCNKLKFLSSHTSDITSSVYCYAIIKQDGEYFFFSSNREKKHLKRADNPQYLPNKLYFKIGLFASNVKSEGLNLPKKKLNTPEGWFKDILNNLTEYRSPNSPLNIFYKLDNEIVMEMEFNDQDQNSGTLYVGYSKIWSVFETRFNMNRLEIQGLIKSMVEDTYNLRGVTPKVEADITGGTVEDTYNLRGVTPLDGSCRGIN